MAGGGVPLQYKGREHVWDRKVKQYAEGGGVGKGGAAFGTFPQMKPRRAKQDREAAKNVPVDLARGFVSGVLGAPGDIESLARLPYELITGKDSPTFLPTSEDIEKRLPFRSEAPVSRAASGAGQLAGGFYMGPGSPLRAVGALPGAIKHGAQEFAMASTKGIPKMFIGPKAKTWDQAKADAAARMEKQGVDPVEIWRQTGTFRGADGIPRQEISDANAVFRDPKQLKEFGLEKKAEAQALKERMATPVGQKDMFPKALTEAKKSTREKIVSLKDEADELMRDPDYRGQSAKFVLDHPELYKAYPELADINVTQGRRGAMGERASISGDKRGQEMDVTQEGLRNNPRSSVLHEMQHAVQTLEDMAPGGNPQMAYNDPRAFKILDELRQMASKPMSFEDYTQRFDHLSDPQKGYEDYVKSLPKVVKDLDRDLQSKAAMEYYKRLAGEAEARATQAREPMSASQRSREFPYSSYDVPPEDLIVKDPKMAGGEVGMKKGGSTDSIRPTDVKNKGALGVANALRKAHEFASKPFGYDNPPGQMISEFLGVPAVSRTLERIGYGEPLTTGKGMTLKPRDDTTEAALSVLPLAPMTKGLPVGAVIKPKGGNFLTGSVEKALAPLKRYDLPDLFPELGSPPPNSAANIALNQWIDRNLGNYIKKEMATPEDPVRRLAEEGITHLPADAMNRGQWLSDHMEAIRRSEGFPEAGMARTEAGRGWENLADESIQITAPIVANKEMLAANPWLSKLDPSQSVYRAREADVSELGFDHIMDVLRQDVASGRIRPEQLSKVSMEQAVRRTYDFDQEMAKKMREAQIKATEGMPVHKEYPEGYKWIELAPPKDLTGGVTLEPKAGGFDIVGPNGEDIGWAKTELEAIRISGQHKALEDALKYEGKTMGHCVGGYCPDVLEGRSRIYSLRDAKGEPHVTVEVQPPEMRGGQTAEEWLASPQRITQIKGKGNRAPKEDYLPFVQDFVRGGKWSDVGDFKNTGLIRKSDLIDRFGPDDLDAIGKGEYLTKGEYDDLLLKALKPEGMKAGGPVKMAGGGAIKEALKKLLKKEKVDHPLVFPRAEPKSVEQIRPIAQRMAEQMTGDFVRQNPKVTTNVAGKSRKQFEREKSIPLVTRNVVPESAMPPIDYEKFKDYAMVGVPGDPTLGGVAKRGSLTENTKPTVELTQVGDITPDQPVPLFGGPRFGNDEVFWASNADAAAPVQSNVNALSELYDAPVLGKYIKMASDSANFALHNLDSLLAIQRPERLNPGKMEQLNDLIRKGSPKYGEFPGFKGFDDPADVLLQSQLNSKLRKHIAETLTKPTITDAFGLPNGLDVVAAITHPQLRNLETGVSGFSVGQMTPGATLRRGESAHPTYDTNIPGQLIGQNKYPTPYEIAFPDTTAYARSQLKPGVQEFNMMKLLGPREKVDQQYIDEMKMYEELMKQYTGRKKGGAVSGLSAATKSCGCHD